MVIISAPTIIVWGLRSEKEGIAQTSTGLGALASRSRGPRSIFHGAAPKPPQRESDA
jgi:hypothetical protein